MYSTRGLSYLQLWLGFVSICLGNNDSLEGSPQVDGGTAASKWMPIRIKVSTNDLDDPLKYCVAPGMRRPDFMGGNVRCTTRDVLTSERRLMLTEHALPSAIQLHAERLLVEREADKIVIPKFDSLPCTSFTVPIHHRSVGVSNADTVLYVASGPSRQAAAAQATVCACLASRRPIAGVINFSPNAIADTYLYIRTVAHEIAHVLGFNFDVMKQLNMISAKENANGRTSSWVVTTSMVVATARQYYGCDQITGVELEDNGDESIKNSHWKRLIARDDLMSAVIGVSHYSALTLSFFADTGLYKVMWGKEEKMRWGRGAGCRFIGGRCMKNNDTHFPEMFCNESSSVLSCTYDRHAVGRCTVRSYAVPLPADVRYFTMPWVGGSDNNLMDYCPVVEPYTDSYCKNGRTELLPGSRIGHSSRCVKGEGLVAFTTNIGDICVEVHCGKEGVNIRYNGDDRWYSCPEGGYVTPTKTFSKGRILCPTRDEVCYDSSTISFRQTIVCAAGTWKFLLLLLLSGVV